MAEEEEIRKEIDKLIKVRRWGTILLDCGKDGFIVTHERRLFGFLAKGDLRGFIQAELACEETERFKTLEEGLAYYQKEDQAFEDFFKNEKKDPLGKKPKRAEMIKANEDLAIRLRSGLVSEKGLAFSILLSGKERNVVIDMDYKALWIGDVIAWAIVDSWGLPRSEEQKKMLQEARENFGIFERHFTKLRDGNPERHFKDLEIYADKVFSATFTCNDVRKRTGKYWLSNREVFELVKKFGRGGVTRKSKVFTEEDGDNWYVFGELDNVCKIQFLKTGKYSNRTKEPEYYFTPIFDNAQGIDFFLSVRLGFFDHRAASYYSMSEGAQWIVRAVGWSGRSSHLKLETLVRITKIKDSNKSKQQKQIESCLNEARRNNYITAWKPNVKREGIGGRKRVSYSIYKVKEWPKI